MWNIFTICFLDRFVKKLKSTPSAYQIQPSILDLSSAPENAQMCRRVRVQMLKAKHSAPLHRLEASNEVVHVPQMYKWKKKLGLCDWLLTKHSLHSKPQGCAKLHRTVKCLIVV
jgi:hypothetical protein